MELAEQLMEDIADVQARERMRSAGDGLVRVDRDLLSNRAPCTRRSTSFEQAMRDNDTAIAPSMIYAYAALKSGVPFANGAPNLTVDIPALTKLAEQNRACRSAARTSRPARR